MSGLKREGSCGKASVGGEDTGCVDKSGAYVNELGGTETVVSPQCYR